jgi:hypothetical protein
MLRLGSRPDLVASLYSLFRFLLDSIDRGGSIFNQVPLQIRRSFEFSPRATLQDHINFLHLCLRNPISDTFLAVDPANTTEAEVQ